MPTVCDSCRRPVLKSSWAEQSERSILRSFIYKTLLVRLPSSRSKRRRDKDHLRHHHHPTRHDSWHCQCDHDERHRLADSAGKTSFPRPSSTDGEHSNLPLPFVTVISSLPNEGNSEQQSPLGLVPRVPDDKPSSTNLTTPPPSLLSSRLPAARPRTTPHSAKPPSAFYHAILSSSSTSLVRHPMNTIDSIIMENETSEQASRGRERISSSSSSSNNDESDSPSSLTSLFSPASQSSGSSLATSLAPSSLLRRHGSVKSAKSVRFGTAPVAHQEWQSEPEGKKDEKEESAKTRRYELDTLSEILAFPRRGPEEETLSIRSLAPSIYSFSGSLVEETATANQKKVPHYRIARSYFAGVERPFEQHCYSQQGHGNSWAHSSLKNLAMMNRDNNDTRSDVDLGGVQRKRSHYTLRSECGRVSFWEGDNEDKSSLREGDSLGSLWLTGGTTRKLRKSPSVSSNRSAITSRRN